MQPARIIGVTGGIGSGKSIVCKILAHLGYPVYYADEQAKALMNSDPELRSQLTELFGPQAYSEGDLNRSFIASQIFSTPALRESMNQIVHPAVRTHFRQWAAGQSSELVFQESALLFETGNYQTFDAIILVTAPEAVRMQRVRRRDALDDQQILSRINSQLSDSEKRQLTDFEIVNDDEQMIIPQVLHVLKELRST